VHGNPRRVTLSQHRCVLNHFFSSFRSHRNSSLAAHFLTTSPNAANLLRMTLLLRELVHNGHAYRTHVSSTRAELHTLANLLLFDATPMPRLPSRGCHRHMGATITVASPLYGRHPFYFPANALFPVLFPDLGNLSAPFHYLYLSSPPFLHLHPLPFASSVPKLSLHIYP
jgi:hypothetical protein